MRNRMYPRLKVRGCTAPDGRRYIAIKQHGKEWLVPYQDLQTDAPNAFRLLAEQGMPIGGRGLVAQLMEEVQVIDEFPEEEIGQYSGWNDTLYLRTDGEVLAPAAAKKIASPPSIGFHRQPDRYRRIGKQADWKKKIAEPLRNDDVATFLIGLAFAPAVRTLLSYPQAPIACQLISGQNLRTVRRTILSVIGSASEESLTTDPLEKLLANPQRFVAGSRDNLLVMGDIEGYLCGGTGKKRKEALTLLLFDFLLPSADCHTNAAGAPAPSFVVIEHRPLAELLGSGLIGHSQKMTVAASATAARKTVGHLS